MGGLTPLTERLLRSLLQGTPPCVAGVSFARAVERRRGEPEEEVARVVRHLRASFELGELAPVAGLAELVVNVADREPESAGAIVAALRAAWPRPTPCQADALRWATACVELAAAREAGLPDAAVGLLRFCVDPMRPPSWHRGFEEAVDRSRERLTPEVFAAIEGARARLPTLVPLVAADLARAQRRVEAGA